jgi:hypothetical protein
MLKFTLLVLALPLFALVPAPLRADEPATWRIEFVNDVFFDSDNGISAGLSLQHHSAAAPGWDSLRGVSRLRRGIGRLLRIPRDGGWVCRAGLAVGQLIQTPTDLTRRDLIEGDVPYAGVLALQSGWYAYSDAEFRGFELMVGVSGPLSLAGPSQRGIHRLIRCTVPQGWDNQLASELLLNLGLAGKRKLLRLGGGGAAADLTLSGEAALGNFLTHASAGLELRAGINMPAGFAPLPGVVALGMQQAASLPAAHPRGPSLQAVLALRGTALARALLWDGNTFAHSHRVERRAFIGLAVAGLRLDAGPVGIAFYAMGSTPIVRPESAPAADERELLGMIHFELRL